MITLTDTAAVKVKELITARGRRRASTLRVAVRPGGCSGFSYEMFFDTDVADDDIITDYGGVKVVVDPSSAQLLDGATLDYKDGLQGAGFAINNPNAAAHLRLRPSPSADRQSPVASRLRWSGEHLVEPGLISVRSNTLSSRSTMVPSAEAR